MWPWLCRREAREITTALTTASRSEQLELLLSTLPFWANRTGIELGAIPIHASALRRTWANVFCTILHIFVRLPNIYNVSTYVLLRFRTFIGIGTVILLLSAVFHIH